jgi:superfamily II DNA or RNA helicase
LTKDQFDSLRKVMSYTITKDYYSPWGQIVTKSLLTKLGEFPTGLLYLLPVDLYSSLGTLNVHNNRKEPIASLSRFKPLSTAPRLTLYPEQKDAANAAKLHSRGILVAPTGVGKSQMIRLIIEKLGVNTLVVVPSLELKRQLTETLTEYYGNKVGSLKNKKPIAVENVDSLDPKKKLIGYDSVIIDEYHHSASKTYQDLNKYAWVDVYHRFGLTATPFRTQSEEKILLESILSEVIYEVKYQTAVDKGYIVPIESYFINVPKTKDVKGIKWPQVYNELVVNNKPRNIIITRLLDLLKDKPTLCLVKEIAHGENLLTINTCFINGVDEDSRRYLTWFNEGKINTLIGTTGIIGEGVDTKPCEYVVISGLGKSRSAFMQMCGRGVRRYKEKESCKVIIFKDDSHKFTKNHFKEECKILLEEYGVIPTEIII